MGKEKRKPPAGAKRPSSLPQFASTTVIGSLLVLVLAVAASSWAMNFFPSSATQNVTMPDEKMPERPPTPDKPREKSAVATQEAPPRRKPPVKPDAVDDGLKDGNALCETWAASGECENNPVYMAEECEKSCAGKVPAAASNQPKKPTATKAAVAKKGLPQVDWTQPELPAELAAAQAEADARPTQLAISRGGCTDARPDCAELARWNLSACGEAEFMLRECPKTCRTCAYGELVGGLTDCKDTHEQCANWARSGECEANRRFMLSGCSKACKVCEAKRHGCARREPTPGVRSPSGMYNMFERALRDFPQHDVKALSTSPYVLQFDNVVTPEEAKQFQRLAGDRLERSLAGDAVSPVRTSTQFWCDDADGCTSDPTIVEVTKRMMNITQLPVDHAEYFQILRCAPLRSSLAHPRAPSHSSSLLLTPPHSTSPLLTPPHSSSLLLTPPHSSSLHLTPCPPLHISLHPTWRHVAATSPASSTRCTTTSRRRTGRPRGCAYTHS